MYVDVAGHTASLKRNKYCIYGYRVGTELEIIYWQSSPYRAKYAILLLARSLCSHVILVHSKTKCNADITLDWVIISARWPIKPLSLRPDHLFILRELWRPMRVKYTQVVKTGERMPRSDHIFHIGQPCSPTHLPTVRGGLWPSTAVLVVSSVAGGPKSGYCEW